MTLLKHGASVLLEDGGPTKAARQKFLKLAKESSPDVKTILISLEIDEASLLERLRSRDRQSPEARWEEQYTTVKRDLYELPDKSEADHLLRYTQDNIEEGVSTLRGLLNCHNLKLTHALNTCRNETRN